MYIILIHIGYITSDSDSDSLYCMCTVLVS